MSVIPLPIGDGNYRCVPVIERHRWRGQFGLAPVAEDRLADQAHKIDLGENVDVAGQLRGPLTSRAWGRLRFAGRIPQRAKRGRPRRQRLLRLLIAIFLKVGPPARLVPCKIAVYGCTTAPRQVAISVSSAGGDLADNVNRWRQQVQTDSAWGRRSRKGNPQD